MPFAQGLPAADSVVPAIRRRLRRRLVVAHQRAARTGPQRRGRKRSSHTSRARRRHRHGVRLAGSLKTVASAALGWVAAVLLIYSMRLPAGLHLPAYAGGAVGHAIAFYWAFPTVAPFGGFGLAISGLIFGLFIVTGQLALPWCFPSFIATSRRSSTASRSGALSIAIAIA